MLSTGNQYTLKTLLHHKTQLLALQLSMKKKSEQALGKNPFPR